MMLYLSIDLPLPQNPTIEQMPLQAGEYVQWRGETWRIDAQSRHGDAAVMVLRNLASGRTTVAFACEVER